MGETKHSKHTSAVLFKNPSGWLFKRSAQLEFSCSAWLSRTSSSTVLKLLRTCHRPTCEILSNIFLKSTMWWNRSHWCCRCFFVMIWLLKICLLCSSLGPCLQQAGKVQPLPVAPTGGANPKITRTHGLPVSLPSPHCLAIFFLLNGSPQPHLLPVGGKYSSWHIYYSSVKANNWGGGRGGPLYFSGSDSPTWQI